jgi:tryptophan synthase alpha chain
MSRLTQAFERAAGRTGLIPFITAGYPSLDHSLEMLRGFAELGARAVEIGIPFSDPIADGPEIQRASEWALRAGVGVSEALGLVERLRRESELPVVMMTYANPILRDGVAAFAARAQAAGVDGVLVSDLPPDEAPQIWEPLERAGLDTITLVAPTTEPKRLPLLIARCRGFLYCLARTGVTGQSAGESGELPERIATLRRLTPLPIAVGFGISTAERARALRGLCDAIVVGAAFMRRVAENPEHDAPARVLTLATELERALHA